MGNNFLPLSLHLIFLQVEILEGKDAGKQGKVVQVVRQRIWVVLEGLNTVSLEKSSPSLPFSLREAWGDRKLAEGQAVQLGHAKD